MLNQGSRDSFLRSVDRSIWDNLHFSIWRERGERGQGSDPDLIEVIIVSVLTPNICHPPAGPLLYNNVIERLQTEDFQCLEAVRFVLLGWVCSDKSNSLSLFLSVYWLLSNNSQRKQQNQKTYKKKSPKHTTNRQYLWLHI